MRNKKGMTLIELSLVVVLIGIITTLAIYRYARAQKHTKIREAVIVLKKMWEMEYTYYIANGFSITADGVPLYFGVSANDSELDEKNNKKLFAIGIDPQIIGDARFYYVNTEGAITFAFPKSADSPFNFPDDEIDGSLQGMELGIDNDGRIYIYEDGNISEFE